MKNKEKEIRLALKNSQRVTVGKHRQIVLFNDKLVLSFKMGRGSVAFAHLDNESMQNAAIIHN